MRQTKSLILGVAVIMGMVAGPVMADVPQTAENGQEESVILKRAVGKNNRKRGAAKKVGNMIGVVLDGNGAPLPYATVRIKDRKIGVLADSAGMFRLPENEVGIKDTLEVSYLGYNTKSVSGVEIADEDTVSFELVPSALALDEVTVSPVRRQKAKRKKTGKTHGWALLTGNIYNQDAGECYGYEFHAKKNRTLYLDKVGFYYREGAKQMTRMKFRINIYDMSNVKGTVSKDFVNVLPRPIYFEYRLEGDRSGKFEYELPDPVILPKDAMVEIEFLEDLKDEMLLFKTNVVGKRNWGRSLNEGVWVRCPFATPFFIECIEGKDK